MSDVLSETSKPKQENVIVSAGDALTAKLVEEAGFDGIWVSGFEVSARAGLADNGSLTMTEMLNVCKPIADAVKIPVWVDVDTGYGNFKRTVREFERIGVYGICVEDNMPNKINSLWGEKVPLMTMEDFGKKLNQVAWDERKIKIIARTEALIRGYGQAEAVERLSHYRQCGADILMPHVRNKDDIIKVIGIDIPYAIVPTKFPNMTNERLFDLGYSIVIWANQTERVKIKAVREALQSLKVNHSAAHIEQKLSATLDDMKGLTPDD